jgi:hypothetical protein
MTFTLIEFLYTLLNLAGMSGDWLNPIIGIQLSGYLIAAVWITRQAFVTLPDLQSQPAACRRLQKSVG